MSMYDFDALSDLLQEAGQAGPCLVLDLDRFEANLAQARRQVQPGVRLRVVAKSLACLEMLDRACAGVDAVGVMTFSVQRLKLLLAARPALEHLLGKPFPVSGAHEVLSAHTLAAQTVIWLIDTQERAAQYAQLAQSHGVTLRIALEVDAGLHRGGVDPGDMAGLVRFVSDCEGLSLVGAMGYEPHLPKLPGLLRRAALARVHGALKQAAERVPGGLINTGGSMTFGNYGPDVGVSEVSLGSVLVKPADFDLQSTLGFDPALFIATPILKYLPGNRMPGLEALAPVMGWRRRADLAIYGGYWKAVPVWPEGYGYSGVFGRSSNQEMWSGPALGRSVVDRFAFLRPSQSEAVLPEFGEVLVVSGGQLVDRWETMPVAQ